MTTPASTDDAAIHDVYRALFAAIAARDVGALSRLVTEDFESVDAHGGSCTGRTEFVEEITTFMTAASVVVSRFALTVVRRTEDEAEVDVEITGTLMLDGRPGAKEKTGRSRDCLRLEHDGCLRLCRQVSEYLGPPPFDDEWDD